MRRQWPRPADRPWHVALAAGAAGVALAEAPDAAPAAGAVTVCLLAALRAPGLGVLAAVLLLVGAAGGQIRLAAIDAPAMRVGDGERVTVRVELTTAPRPGRFGSSAEARIDSGRLHGARVLLRAPPWSPLPRSLGPGGRAVVAGRVGGA
ncbi:MAG TPA: hypothetical protein VFQ12_07670, partial [Thermoleophilaceae bacterium]|nr:hypothetical protein [Thermoleophilaceae bacterium]